MISPLVSVTLVTYNSAATIIEALESVKAQTYSNIELIISDDSSTDATIAICQDWIDQNRVRFARVELITAEKNTGTAGNLNRAEALCQGKWVKFLAGDDLLMSNCIQDCVNYVRKNPEAKVIFGRAKAFGASQEECEKWDKNIDNSSLALPAEQLLHKLYHGNCISAVSYFYNRNAIGELNIHNDERIPLLEDWPKWINMLRAGIKFHFVDEVLVKYRLNGISTGKRSSLKYFESERLFRFYYLYPAWMQEDADMAVKRIVQEECNLYKQLLEAESEDAGLIHKQRDEYRQQYEKYYEQYTQIHNSWAYRIGKMILKPFTFLRKLRNV